MFPANNTTRTCEQRVDLLIKRGTDHLVCRAPRKQLRQSALSKAPGLNGHRGHGRSGCIGVQHTFSYELHPSKHDVGLMVTCTLHPEHMLCMQQAIPDAALPNLDNPDPLLLPCRSSTHLLL